MTSFQTLTFKEHFLQVTEKHEVLFVFASGYEARSTYLTRFLADSGGLVRVRVLALTFPDYADIASGPINRDLLRQLDIEAMIVPDSGAGLVVSAVRAAVDQMLKEGVSVRAVIDYSSMPRRWYCALLLHFMTESPVNAHFWYVQGQFPGGEYPCVGYGDFNVFSGRPHVTRTKEVHIFGLGFDSTRTYGIWNFLDPQHTCCLIGESDFNRDLVKKVYTLNHEILLAAEVTENVRFDDFPRLLSGIIDLARKCTAIGDVCLVADGPKPIVLAMSVAPHIFALPGVSSWHIAHVKPDGYVPVDVKPTEHVYGFSVQTARSDAESKLRRTNFTN